MSAFAALTLEAVRDAARRRGLVAAVLASALAAIAIQRCGRCDASIARQGEALGPSADELGAISAIATCGLIALWSYAIAALLASDGLATSLEDGSAESLLSRPVSRDALVLARLAGIWLAAMAIGASLVALAAGIAAVHRGLAPVPALGAVAGLGTSAWCIAAVAMVASLSLPRAATLLLLGILALSAAWIDITALVVPAESGFTPGPVAQWGPAWLAAPVSALAPWLTETPRWWPPPPWPLLRSGAWAALATAVLVWRFRRVDLPR